MDTAFIMEGFHVLIFTAVFKNSIQPEMIS